MRNRPPVIKALAKCLPFPATACGALGLLLLHASPASAELLGVECKFTRGCNNFLACNDIDYALTVARTSQGWEFRDHRGARPAVRLPEVPGKGIPAFASQAAYDSTSLLTLYSGGPALLVEHFEEPGFWSLNGTCDVLR